MIIMVNECIRAYTHVDDDGNDHDDVKKGMCSVRKACVRKTMTKMKMTAKKERHVCVDLRSDPDNCSANGPGQERTPW